MYMGLVRHKLISGCALNRVEPALSLVSESHALFSQMHVVFHSIKAERYVLRLPKNLYNEQQITE